MKVWAVGYDFDVWGVFSTEEKAKHFGDSTGLTDYFIEEFELDSRKRLVYEDPNKGINPWAYFTNKS